MSDRSSTSPPIRVATLAMVVLATVAVELAGAEPGQPPGPLLASTAGLLIAPLLGLSVSLGRGRRDWLGPTAEAVALVALVVLPFATRPLLAAWSGHGAPLEIVLMAALRNLGLGLGALSHRRGLARLAALVSLFLALIAAATGDGPLLGGAVGAYAVAGVGWLMLASWEQLGVAPSGVTRLRPPVGAMAGWAAVVAVLVGCGVALGPTRSATILAELVASSGGTGANDPEARGGVNDGDNEVAASQDPKSIGFTESEVFLESDKPSLYDSFTDQYGELIRPKPKQERMVALAPREGPPQEAPTENLRAGRSFPTARQRPTRTAGRGLDRPAKALAYVKGETPLHLGLATYDQFDGLTWEEEPHTDQHCPLELVPNAGAWLRLDLPMSGPFGPCASHQIKIGTLDSSTLPVPAHVCRLRVGSVNRPDFFAWAQTGLIRMVGRTVPAGTVIDTEARCPDPRLLRSVSFEKRRLTPTGRYLGIPAGLDAGVASLVGSWADGLPRGWAQVEAVVAGVRGRCRHDRSAAVPDDAGDVVGRFLLHAQTGPDHQFATAAAVALRLLGYPCRVVSGYYAAPERYDAATRHTPIHPEDVHFWVEVLLPDGSWAAVEPTPGYELAVPPLALADRLLGGLWAVWGQIRAHWLGLGLGCLVLVGMNFCRRRIKDGIATLLWRLRLRGPARAVATRTLRLLELRSSHAGFPRPPGRTPARWYRSIARDAPAEARAGLDRLVAIAGWASHAPVDLDAAPWTRPEIDAACRRAVRDWPARRFRLLRRPPTPEGLRS